MTAEFRSEKQPTPILYLIFICLQFLSREGRWLTYNINCDYNGKTPSRRQNIHQNGSRCRPWWFKNTFARKNAINTFCWSKDFWLNAEREINYPRQNFLRFQEFFELRCGIPTMKYEKYRHSSISVVSISAIFALTRFIILSYFPPLQYY